MRIAQVAPLFESVPPKLYGGTERVVAYLTEELVRQGHDVTLFASGDSLTSARLVPGCARALRLEGRRADHVAAHVVHLEQVVRHADAFDVIHFHADYLSFPFARRLRQPHLSTLHGRLDIPDLVPVYREFDDLPLISISDAQRRPLPWVHWLATVHHGLPPQLLRFSPGPGRYLAFLGRISPEKRCDRAIAIAQRLGLPLKIAAKVDNADREYFESVIRPLLDHPLVEYIGEIGERDKSAFLGGAIALLFPIDWPEPFGLVMIEAMACGTPVVAWAKGSVPEVIEPGLTGFVVHTLDDAVEHVRRAQGLSRARVRERFEQRFSAARMARDYLAVYRRLQQQHRRGEELRWQEVSNG
jgi:glycosyltransferase involved in cell wall biosynthesis